MNSREFSLAVCMRLGLALPACRGLVNCPSRDCSAVVDHEGLEFANLQQRTGQSETA